MASEGFDYFYDPPQLQLQREQNFEFPYGSVKWSERYGIGISTLLFSQDEVGPDLVGSPGPMLWPDVDEANDPTSRQLEALGEAGQAAYWKALYGMTIGEETSAEDQKLSCFGQASRAHPDRSALVRLEWGEAEVGQLRDRVEASEEVQDMLRRGRLCVQAEGFDLTSRNDAARDIDSRLSALFEIVDMDLADRDFVEQLGSIQAYELEVAQAFLKCEVGPQLEAPVREAVAIRLAYAMGIIVPEEP